MIILLIHLINSGVAVSSPMGVRVYLCSLIGCTKADFSIVSIDNNITSSLS